MMKRPHFLVLTFPAQGHINPALQFAKRLIRIGADVTFVTCVSAYRRMNTNPPTIEGLSFTMFSDGYDDGLKEFHDPAQYMSEFKRRGSETLTNLVLSSQKEGRSFTCIVYTILLPWAAVVARASNVPSALLWIQPATVLDIYYYYFYGYGDTIRNNANDPSRLIQLPGLPPLINRDLPSFVMPSNTYAFALPTFQEQLVALCEETNPKILVNTFDALEPEALKAISEFNMIGVGPLIPSAFLDGKDPSDTSSGGDLFHGSKDYIDWLDSKQKSSVIYVSFGTIAVLKKQQVEEIARGLLDSGRPFLWVIRAKDGEGDKEEEDEISFREELEQQGMIVPWCSQLEVLSHRSLGCFVTHCGWNSTLESLAAGVPLVAFPQWTDQGTNAKLIEDVWKTGVRVTVDEDGIVRSDEIMRCLELVMGGGEKAEELRKNAGKWKDLAREATKEGGCSDKNLRRFVDEVSEGCT
ncbi:hypothetical protein SLA2020_519970 [Shorea laevis]